MTHDDTYQACIALAQRHYENFPVASWVLPRTLRRPVAVVYAYARTIDDFADEGDYTSQQRLALLTRYDEDLYKLQRGEQVDVALLNTLKSVIQQYEIPWSLFHDLISAFIQDVTTTSYASRAAVLDYCQRSANPVGRILLYMFGHTTERDLNESDAICSSLQLINFLQDIQQDYAEHQRVYLPRDQMRLFGVEEAHLQHRISDDAMRQLLESEIFYARAMMLQGAPLAGRLPGRIGLELRLIVAGGLKILKKLERQRDDLFTRPRLTFTDKLSIFFTAVVGWKQLDKHTPSANNAPTYDSR